MTVKAVITNGTINLAEAGSIYPRITRMTPLIISSVRSSSGGFSTRSTVFCRVESKICSDGSAIPLQTARLFQGFLLSIQRMSGKSFRHKVAVITGASAGIGRASALAFAREGASVGLISRNKKRLQKARGEIEQRGGIAEYYVADVADPKSLEAAAEFFERRLEPIYIWINNAMVSVFAPVREITPDEFRRVLEVTCLGQVHGTMSALRRMMPRDRGVIVLVGSALAYRGIPLQAPYCAAKHAVKGFYDALRAELLHDGSRVVVTMVTLPAFNTRQFDWVKSTLSRRAQPVPPIYQPEIAAEAVLWAARRRIREVIVGLPAFRAIFLNKFIPGMIDGYLAQRGSTDQQICADMEIPDRPHNLWRTVEGDFGAHGRFDRRAHTRILPF